MNENQYQSFVFYGSWTEYIEAFGEDKAKEIFFDIICIGTGRKNIDDIKDITNKGIIKAGVFQNIQAAQKRHCKAIIDGSHGGRPRIDLPIEEIKALRTDGKTLKSIADYYHVDEKTIRNRLAEEAIPQIEELF